MESVLSSFFLRTHFTLRVVPCFFHILVMKMSSVFSSTSYYFLLWYCVWTLGLWCFCQIYPAIIITHTLEFLISLHKQKCQVPSSLVNAQKMKEKFENKKKNWNTEILLLIFVLIPLKLNGKYMLHFFSLLCLTATVCIRFLKKKIPRATFWISFHRKHYVHKVSYIIFDM